jgi:hypothetical protein
VSRDAGRRFVALKFVGYQHTRGVPHDLVITKHDSLIIKKLKFLKKEVPQIPRFAGEKVRHATVLTNSRYQKWVHFGGPKNGSIPLDCCHTECTRTGAMLLLGLTGNSWVF